MPPDRVQRIDQLAPRQAVAGAPPPPERHRLLVALEQRWPFGAAHPQRHAQKARALVQEGQIETKQVMILDHIGVALADQRAEISDQIGFVAWVRRFKNGGQPARITHGHQEDPPAPRAQRGRFEIELKPVQIAIREVAKVGSPGRHQVLLDRADPVVALLYVV